MLTTIGKPGQSRMSKFGSLTGKQAPVAKPTRQFYGPGGAGDGSGNGQAQQRTKKPTNKPPTRKNVTPRPTAKPKPPTRKRKPQAEVGSKNPSKAAKDSNMKAWAKANPGLAKKVKKGQEGYKAIQSVINPNKNNEKKPRRFSNKSLRKAGQRTYNRGGA